jgi:putative hemolysin
MIIFLIFLNGALALSEIAILSARKTRLEDLARQGDRRARIALDLAIAPSSFLSTIQVGITLIGILAGVIGGVTISRQLDDLLKALPYVAAYSRSLSIFLTVSTITYISLIFGELVPKRFALNHPEAIALRVAIPIRALCLGMFPAVKFLTASIEFVMKLLHMPKAERVPITDEEIRILIAEGTQSGLFEKTEQEMMNRMLRLADRTVSSVMTPRLKITHIDLEKSTEENLQILRQSTHTRLPVSVGGLESLIGVAQVKDLLMVLQQGEPVESVVYPAVFVPEKQYILKLLELFKQSGTHMAIVVNEYGDIEGLITLHDVLEAIVGQIPAPEEIERPAVVGREDGTLLIDGLLPILELKEVLHIKNLPDEEYGRYDTLAGLMLDQLGRIPTPGNYFTWRGLRFEIVDMDGKRIDKVLVGRIASQKNLKAAG